MHKTDFARNVAIGTISIHETDFVRNVAIGTINSHETDFARNVVIGTINKHQTDFERNVATGTSNCAPVFTDVASGLQTFLPAPVHVPFYSCNCCNLYISNAEKQSERFCT